MRTIGDRVREIFEERQKTQPGLSGADINEAIGKGRTSGYFSRLMKNQRNDRPDKDALKKIADHFGVSFEWLYLGRGDKHAKSGMPTDVAELLRVSVNGLAPRAPGEGLDNLDAVLLYRQKKYSPALVAELREELSRDGVSPNSKTPQEWDDELSRRLLRQLRDELLERKASAEQAEELADLERMLLPAANSWRKI